MKHILHNLHWNGVSYYLYSTVSNCPAPAPAGGDQQQEQVDETEGDTEQNEAERKTPAKHKTKSQSERDDNLDKILKLAQSEDHPVELTMTAVAKQMIRNLTKEEQDDLLSEIQSVSAQFFREKHRKRKADSTVQQIVTPPPPPLTLAGMQQQAQIQQLESDGILVEVGSLPPLEQYNSMVQYVSDDGHTYMKLN